MTTYHEFDHAGRHYRFVYDETHETRGSYAYATPKETKAAEDRELHKLDIGAWVVLGCIVTEPCPANKHCPCCSGSHEVDSLWGIVIDNSHKAAEAFAKETL